MTEVNLHSVRWVAVVMVIWYPIHQSDDFEPTNIGHRILDKNRKVRTANWESKIPEFQTIRVCPKFKVSEIYGNSLFQYNHQIIQKVGCFSVKTFFRTSIPRPCKAFENHRPMFKCYNIIDSKDSALKIFETIKVDAWYRLLVVAYGFKFFGIHLNLRWLIGFYKQLCPPCASRHCKRCCNADFM